MSQKNERHSFLFHKTKSCIPVISFCIPTEHQTGKCGPRPAASNCRSRQKPQRFLAMPSKSRDTARVTQAGDKWNISSVCMHAKSLQLCLTLCNHTDGSPPGSSFLGILQARILEWVSVPSSRGPYLGIETASLKSPKLADRFFTTSTTCGAHQQYHKVTNQIDDIFLNILEIYENSPKYNPLKYSMF